MEYINPENKKVVDGGLANYLHKITLFLSAQGHDINVLVINAPKNVALMYNGIRVDYLKTAFKKNIFQKLLWPLFSAKRRKLIKRASFWKNITSVIHKISHQRNIDIIQYTSCLGIGRYPEKDIPSCLRISSYAKLMQKYYDYHDEGEIQYEIEQLHNHKFIFGPSRHIINYIIQDLNLKKNIKIIESPYSSVDVTADNRVLNDLKTKIKNSPFLLFFGTIGKLKGCGIIAQCIYEILERYPDLYLVLIGKSYGNIDYATSIKTNAKKYSEHIIRYQSLPHSQLYPIISAATGILMPSLTENFSNACVEAMRLGKIVIGTEGNFSQLITDGFNGFLAKIGDPISLKDKIITLMSLSPEKKREMERQAFLRTESLSPEIICRQLLDYYQYIVNHWKE